MAGTTIYLLSNDLIYRRKFAAALGNEPSLRLEGCFDALSLLRAAQIERPARLIIMDVQQEKLEWIALAEQLMRMKTVVLLTGSSVSDRFLSRAIRAGVSGFVAHQQGFGALMERCILLGAGESVAYRADRTPEERVGSLLVQLGMESHLSGYHYLCYMIARVLEDETCLMQVGKVLYAAAAKHFDRPASVIERSVRHAIAALWNALNLELGAMVLGKERCYQQTRPSNGIFMGWIADYLRKIQ